MSDNPIKKPCGMTTIPTIDNENPPCDYYLTDSCVLMSRDYPFFRIREDNTLTSLIVKLEEIIRRQSVNIRDLQERVDMLEQ